MGSVRSSIFTAGAVVVAPRAVAARTATINPAIHGTLAATMQTSLGAVVDRDLLQKFIVAEVCQSGARQNGGAPPRRRRSADRIVTGQRRPGSRRLLERRLVLKERFELASEARMPRDKLGLIRLMALVGCVEILSQNLVEPPLAFR